MKQIVDKLNKIAKKIDESVEIPQTDLIIDSLDAITKAYGGTPNDSNLIVDKLEDIYNNISSVPSGNIEITENTAEPLDISQYATATVNVAGGSGIPYCAINYQASDISFGDTFIALADGGLGYERLSGLETDTTYNALYILHDNTYAAFIPSLVDVLEAADMVNCTFEYSDDAEGYIIAITDPTVNSSITITDKQ